MKLEGLKINFLGDSITEGVGASSADTVYHAVLKKEAGLSEARNYGISATRFAIQKGTPERPKDDYVDVNSFCERFEQMDDDADVVLVFDSELRNLDIPVGFHPNDNTAFLWLKFSDLLKFIKSRGNDVYYINI